MPSLKNDRFLRALRREPVDQTPVWMMRQAGRYLPEYRRVREQAGDFLTLCKNPEWATEVTVQPLDRFALDAAIIFSDILTVPHAMGMDLSFIKGEGPVFASPLRDANAIKQLGNPDPEIELRYVMDAIRLAQKTLDGCVPLIGFSGSPWTLACYMVEGCGSKTFQATKTLRYQNPALMHTLLQRITTSVIAYVKAQAAAGANAIMIFDTWGGMLSHGDYLAFSLAYMRPIVEALKGTVPVTLFTKQGGQWLESIAETGCDGIGLDWTTDIGSARKRVGDRVALQGNLDPMALYGSPESIREEVEKIMEQFGPHPGHIFNLGHGITPETPIENVEVMIEAVKANSMSILGRG